MSDNHQDYSEKTSTFEGLDYAHISTILAALRYFQANRDDVIDCQMPHFIDVDPLTYEQIDDLCMAINAGD
jgi:hypothetical protein